MTDGEYRDYCVSLGLSPDARDFVSRIRNSPPVRRVRGGGGNVRGRYASRKMGRTIQFESHTCELPTIYGYERSRPGDKRPGNLRSSDRVNGDYVRAYYDQPCQIKLRYEKANGKPICELHTPDFCVLWAAGVELVECKPEEKLLKLSVEKPERYRFDEATGRWRCPPGEAFTASLGLKYTIVSTNDLNRTLVRNFVYLEDYFAVDTPIVPDGRRERILDIIRDDEGLFLSDLLAATDGTDISVDDVNTLIATGDVFVDLEHFALAENARVPIYSGEDVAVAADTCTSRSPKAKVIQIREGARIIRDNKVSEIDYVGDTKISLVRDDGKAWTLSFERFDELVAKGEVHSVSVVDDVRDDDRGRRIINEAPEGAKKEANRRKRILDQVARGQKPDETVPERTLFRWKSAAKWGEANCGNALVGLLPKYHLRGDRKPHFDPAIEAVMDEVIRTQYLTFVNEGKAQAYGTVRDACKARGISVPSASTFYRRVNVSSEYQSLLTRQGAGVAYAKAPFFFTLERDTPRHGDRPFEVCHIDHTLLDVELVHSTTKQNMGRPWLTIMTDGFSRRVLASYMTFDRPTAASCMMVIRDCVRRFRQLPQTIVVDGGSDFHSIYFQTLAAAFEITIKIRPGKKPKFGSTCERVFNTANVQLVFTVIGNTQITRKVRQMTRANDPKRLAVWTLKAFHEAFREWAEHTYDTAEHWTLKVSPREAFASSLRMTGTREHRRIVYDEEFKRFTLPGPTDRPTRMYHVGRGFKLDNEWYRYDEAQDVFREHELGRLQLTVRFDPFDITRGYLYWRDRWVECFSQDHVGLLDCPESEVAFVSAEERQLNRLYNRKFGERAGQRGQERRARTTLEQQLKSDLDTARRRNSENQSVRAVINEPHLSSTPLDEPRRSPAFDIDYDNLPEAEEYTG